MEIRIDPDELRPVIDQAVRSATEAMQSEKPREAAGQILLGKATYELVKSQVKEATELNVASDVYDALEDKVREMIKSAEARAKENGRKTIKAYDL